MMKEVMEIAAYVTLAIVVLGLSIRYPKQAASVLFMCVAVIGLVILGGITGAGRSKARNVN